MKKVLMVCLGNICRSPMAQGILEKKMLENNLVAEVDSAGTASYHVGEPPDSRAGEIAQKYGVDITSYRGRQFIPLDFDNFDFIFAMDTANLRDILAQVRSEKDRAKVDLILNKLFPAENRSVPDPYYGGDRDFENVYLLLDKACEKIIEELVYAK